MFLLGPLITLTSLLALVGQAQDKAVGSGSSAMTTPVCRWQTADDTTGKIDSAVALWEENGKLYGRIERLINPNPNDPDPRCLRCSNHLGSRKKWRPVVWRCDRRSQQRKDLPVFDSSDRWQKEAARAYRLFRVAPDRVLVA